MSLYLKEKKEKLQNIAKEQKEATKRKRKEAPKYTARILSAVGVLCVLAVIVGVAAFMPILSKADTTNPTGWQDYPMYEGATVLESENLGSWGFSQTYGSITKLGDLEFIGTEMQDGESLPCAAIKTEDQLKAVLSGLKTSIKITGSGEYGETTEIDKERNTRVIFKLTEDMTIKDWMLDESQSFEMDIFDGQGHSITCSYDSEIRKAILNNDKHFGMLFGKVSGATIRNLQVEIENHDIELVISEGGPDFLGIGGVCGVADSANFSDIEISGGWTVNYAHTESVQGRNDVGLGGLIGTAKSGVTITRCKDDSNIHTNITDLRNGLPSAVVWGTGGIVGQIIDTGNTIHACWGNGDYTYSFSKYSETEYSHCFFNRCGTIVGIVDARKLYSENSDKKIVTIEDSAGRDTEGVEIIAIVHVKDNDPRYNNSVTDDDINEGIKKAITVKNCYGKSSTDESGNIVYGCYWSYFYDTGGEKHVETGKKEVKSEESGGSLSGRNTRINETDWGYNSIDGHYLLHPVTNGADNYVVQLDSLNIGDPLGEEHKITVTGKISLQKQTIDSGTGKVSYINTTFPENATAYLYMTTDGETDPRENAVSNDSVKGNNQNEIELSASTNYSDPSENLTVRVRIKVVFDEGTNTNGSIWWSSLYEKEFDASDLYIDEPTLQVSVDNQAYEDFQETTAYPLGTTKLQLTGNGETEYTMYYDFRDRSDLILGETDSDSTIYWHSMTQQNKYIDPFTLTEDMVKNASSNKVYMYVLAHIKKDNVDYYRLYEYDIVVFAKDKLISVSRDSGSKIPNDSTVTFKVGNGLEGEYPYNKMNVLISEEQKQYRTLEGQSGVVTYAGDEYKKPSETNANLSYLTVDLKLSGKPGQTFYVYVEPCVNESGDYTSRYGRFVMEYTYMIMDKAAGLELSPSTITMAQSGTPTSIPINEKVFMNSGGNSDIIVYRKTTQAIEPVMLTSAEPNVDENDLTSVGESAYGWSEDKTILYIRCNGLWYSISNTDKKLCVYKDGSLFFDASYAGKTAYISTVLFSAGYDPSDNWIYKYTVNEQEAVAAPTALMPDGSSISMGKVLNFYCAQDCVMYYTTDGTDPVVTVVQDAEDPDKKIIEAAPETFRYDPATGIVVTTENGFSYGTDILIKLVAYPVEDASADKPVYNSDKKNSDIAAFTYTIREQNQVETPIAYPETSTGNVAVVVKGSRISLSCATPGAEIYYTVNGGTPSTASNKYTGAITVDGEYGSYFTVRAIAHKEGMKDSEVAVCLYRIAEKNTVSGVTAIPSTTNQVIAGDKIILSTTEPGADIYYTIDGTTPDVVENENGTYTLSEGVYKYVPAEAVKVPEGSGYFVIHAIAVKAEMSNSPVAQFLYTYVDSVGAPYGNPSSGTVTENTQVALRCANENAIIYYEIAYGGAQPAEPTTSSAIFSEKAPIIITRDTKIKAFAYYNRQSSEVVTLSYKLAQKMETPTSSVSSGAIVPSGTTVSLSSGGGKVYYTTDGSDPMDSTNTAVNIGSDVVITGKAGDKIIIKACTRETGATTSEIVTFTYQISQYPGGVTTDTTVGSTLAGGTSIHLMTDVTGGTIYYTTGSGSPITAGTAGNSVVLSGKAGSNITVKAVAVAPNTTMTGSYASFDYKLMEQLAAPNASIKDGTRLTGETGVVLKANKGKIYFTIDGTEPTKASNEYTAPIVVSKAMTIKAIAIEEGSVNSDVSTFSYTFAEKVKNITSSVPTGTVVQSGEVVKLTCATKDARIYYTTDGTDPSVNAEEGVFVYDEKEGISIYRSVNIKAIAVKDDLCDSEVLSLNYQVEEVPVEIAREKAAQAEEEAGLKPSDLSKLESRRVQPDEEEPADGYVQISDIISNVIVQGKQSVISEETTLRGKEIAASENAKAEIRNLLGDDYELICNYSFALYENGERIQPEEMLEIGIPIPEEYENADVAIISINENGGVKVCSTRRENGYAYAEASHLNSFAIVGAKQDENHHNEWNLALIMSAVAGVLALGGIGMITITMDKRKRF